jgi:hypothetical protein
MTLITGKHLPRRTFLRGAGVAVALPLLESMIPALSRAATSAPKTRFAAIFSPHGWCPTYWADGRAITAKVDNLGLRNTGLGFIHQPLAPWKDQLTIFGGLDCTAAMPPAGLSGGDHARAAATFTGAAPKKTAGSDVWCGPSIDQIIAQKYGQETLLPSMQLGIEDPGSNTGLCGWGYSCAYSNSVSWAAPDKPLPHEISPMAAFQQMYGDGSNPQERVARRQTDSSILDEITAKIGRLSKSLPPADRARLNDYMDSIRELERRLQVGAKISAEAPNVDLPFGVPESFDEHVKLHHDLQVLSFQGDVTRVSSIMYARDISLRSYPESGVKTPNHSSSHHGENTKRMEEWAKINQYHSKCVAYLLKRLQDTPDGDGNLLDHTLVMWGSNMGNANQHSHVNVGFLMAGGASGKHKAKLNVDSSGTTANALLKALHIMGVERDSIGDSTGAISI